MSGEDRVDRLLAEFPADVAAHLRARLAAEGRVAIDPEEVAASASVEPRTVEACLDRLAAAGLLAIEPSHVHRPCEFGLREEDLDAPECPNCLRELVPDDLRQVRWYVKQAARRRDVPWVITVHGMNTRGIWQEELNWRLATSYHRPVPVYAFRYGRLQVGALLRWRQRQLADRLAATIHQLSGEPQGSRLGRRPDVVCHSFGTWLVGHALRRNPDLEVGRVILVASILRPDFEWQALRGKGQVEAVLNHRSVKDGVVPLATYFVAEAGPSGRSGFDAQVPVVDRPERAYGHSGFFEPEPLSRAVAEVWRPFLRAPVDELQENRANGTVWRPVPWLLRATLPRAFVLFVLAVVTIAVLFGPGLALTALLSG